MALTQPLALTLLAALLLAGTRAAGAESDPAAALERALAAAESSLRDDERQLDESHYRDALQEAWLLRGSLALADGDTPAALAAFERAAAAAVETDRAHVDLALTHLKAGRPGEAVRLLHGVSLRRPRDVRTRQILAQALVADGRPEEAVQELEEIRVAVPDDPELAFTLATGYLRLRRDEAAEALFAEVARRRPIPQTHVLIGRTWRDFGRYVPARAALQAALALDPRVRRAHYYLGTVEVLDEGAVRLEQAIAHFRAELRLAPDDPLANLYLGVALVESRRYAEALPALEIAVRAEPPVLIGVRYLGRCLLGLDRPADAVPHLRRALEMMRGTAAKENELSSVHYQLGQALRRLRDPEAEEHFSAAQRYTAALAETWREQLERYLGGTGEAFTAPIEIAALAGLTPEGRAELQQRTTTALARAYLNLGVMQAQAGRFPRAATYFEQAAEVDPGFPRLQYSLGVAYFNSQQYDKATPPLSRALADTPQDGALRRMLALAHYNVESYERAAELLAGDPERARDPSLQYAYGVALVRSGRAAEAAAIFERLLAGHGGSAALQVVLGQAHAQQGDYPAAVRALRQALSLDPQVDDAHESLGLMHLKKGELSEAEQEFRAELRARPSDAQAQYLLATVLELSQRPQAALELLRAVIAARPAHADARYLSGKILLAGGAPQDAVAHLEAAARLSPDDANVRYQLGQAYRRLGRDAQAEEQFAAHRRLKQAQRSGTP